MSKRQILWAYIREKGKTAAAFLLIVSIFVLVASLYQMENAVGRISYAAVIILFLGSCYAAADYRRYYIKYRKLEEALQNSGEMDYHLPSAEALIEKTYQKMIELEEEERRELITNLDRQQGEAQDYYALWTHQIKTPIAAMRLLLEKEENKEYFEMREELFKIEQYVEMALCYSRIASMSSDLKLEQHEISGIIRQAVKKYALLFINKGLSVTLEDFTCYAVTDEKWLSFVMEQLISNAVKYTVRGSIRIYQREEGIIVIEDTGIGIPTEDIPRIFEKGFTGYNGRMDKKSTGIGLYLCRQILDKLSHPIRVLSEQGKGTTVILNFKQIV